jgi:hypothetical protein
MFGPGEYVPDPTEGIIDVKDLPAGVVTCWGMVGAVPETTPQTSR